MKCDGETAPTKVGAVASSARVRVRLRAAYDVLPVYLSWTITANRASLYFATRVVVSLVNNVTNIYIYSVYINVFVHLGTL